MHRRGDVVVDGVHPPSGGRKRADTLDPLLVRLQGCDIAIRGWPWLVLSEETAHDLHSFYILPAYAWSQLRLEAQRRVGNARSSHSRQGVSLYLAKRDTGSNELYWAGSGRMSVKETDMVASPRSPDGLGVVPVARDGNGPADPWLRIDDHGVSELPVAGQAGHGRTASLRRQPARIVAGRMEGGYTDMFELICGECGDHPYVDYRDIPPRLQRIRGPYMLEAGLRVYEEHLGQTS